MALAGVGIFTAVVLITRDANWTIAGVRLHLREPWKAGLLLAALAAALLVISSRTRALVARSSSDPVGWFAVGAILSAWLACGPVIAIGGSPTDLPAPYALLYTHVPGFDGLRVPARIAMLTACCLAVVAGFGFRLLAGDSRRRQAAAASVMALFLLETTGAPIALNARMAAPGYASPPAPVSTGAQAPEVYRFCASLRSTAVILELPFGAPAWELQYVFYQRVHRRPIVNGYSGGFPETYYARKEALTAPDVTPGIAWRALASSSATHVIVHRGAYVADGGERVERWLRGHGAAMIHAAGSDRLYALRAR